MTAMWHFIILLWQNSNSCIKNTSFHFQFFKIRVPWKPLFAVEDIAYQHKYRYKLLNVQLIVSRLQYMLPWKQYTIWSLSIFSQNNSKQETLNPGSHLFLLICRVNFFFQVLPVVFKFLPGVKNVSAPLMFPLHDHPPDVHLAPHKGKIWRVPVFGAPLLHTLKFLCFFTMSAPALDRCEAAMFRWNDRSHCHGF